MINTAVRPRAEAQAQQLDPRAAAARRKAAIRQYSVLDTEKEAGFDEIVVLAAIALASPFAGISFIDEDRQWFKAELGLGVRQTPLSLSFCAHAVAHQDLLSIRDATKDVRFATNPLVTGEPKIRFYAGVPILAADGTPIAALCVLDTLPRPEGVTEEQRTALKILASQVQTQLELRRAIVERDTRAAEQLALSEELRRVAEQDGLTGLANRVTFNTALAEALSNKSGSSSRAALMLVDVDHFKQVNDSLGHDAGDALLRAFAARLRSTLRAGDMVARLGGDEFGVILRGVGTGERLDALVTSMSARLSEPIEHEGRVIDCGASIGIAAYPDHASTVDALVKCSDLALAAAKSNRGCAVFFDRDLAETFYQESKMAALARDAIQRREIIPYYQPKIDLNTGQLAGLEALARWRVGPKASAHPEMFAQAFGSRHLALRASEQMMMQVLDDMRGWIDAGVPFGHVAINSCAVDFAGNDFGERLLSAIDARGIEPRLIELEVTEGVFLGRGAHHVARALALLSKRGMRVALDDFGTGYASLTHLKQFPVDVIKIDRSFVAGIGRNADDAAIVRALIGLGDSLGIETVAEGIETAEQADFVRTQGCTFGQGFLYDEARPANAVPNMARRSGIRSSAWGSTPFHSRIPYRDAHLSIVRQHQPDRAGAR